MKKFWKSSYLAIFISLIYIPIFIFILFSFNSSESMGIFSGFSDRWYKQLFLETSFLQSILVSIFVGMVATVTSLIIGVMASIGLSKSRKITQKSLLTVNNIPLVNADIITAVGLMLLFLSLSIPFGTVTLVLAHVSFDVPYVIVIVLPAISKIDQKTIDASVDLGASSSQTLRKIILPALKVPIAAAGAVAFAMSFDDFIISYFTSGDQTNVSTFIYTMKRVKPYVNAFGTICIFVISFVIVSWNLGIFIQKRNQKLKKDLLENTYRDKKLYRMELKLIKYYSLLNAEQTSYKKLLKINKSNLILESNQTDLDDKQIRSKDKLRNAIIKLEDKLSAEIKWINKKCEKFIAEKESREQYEKIMRVRFPWIRRTWKTILLVIIVVSSFSLLTAFYIISSNYDLSVANWGEYIDPELITEFQDEYDVKVKYTVYDSNETLYNKLNTTDYDVFFPSDYMVKKLADEDKIDKIDYAELNSQMPLVDGQQYHFFKPNDFSDEHINTSNYIDVDYENEHYPGVYDDFIQHQNDSDVREHYGSLDPNLVQTLWINSLDTKEESIVEYSVPYLWGDISLVINPTPENLAIYNNYQNGLSWQILWDAAEQGREVVLNNDYKNLFMIANEKNYHSVLPKNETELEQDVSDLSDLLSFDDVGLENDEIINTVSDGDFDFSFMYNGDAIYCDQVSQENHAADPFIIKKPSFNEEGTNIYSDNMVISKNCHNKDLAYKFIAFLITNAADTTEYTGYTSPISQILNFEIQKDSTFYDYKEQYIPSTAKNSGPFTITSLDQEMLEAYNRLIASKI
ncbi:extracellular solute-binding protein [Spiroplasma endosymbiont of Amphibalanus improvisus]|uniref:extracellular solute-binding protein n=1 Tax=Spiroplasma endosymbiont of Amphibalanus improvisus TaxID=3066327 RepID=UPI00313E9E51